MDDGSRIRVICVEVQPMDSLEDTPITFFSPLRHMQGILAQHALRRKWALSMLIVSNICVLCFCQRYCVAGAFLVRQRRAAPAKRCENARRARERGVSSSFFGARMTNGLVLRRSHRGHRTQSPTPERLCELGGQAPAQGGRCAASGARKFDRQHQHTREKRKCISTQCMKLL